MKIYHVAIIGVLSVCVSPAFAADGAESADKPSAPSGVVAAKVGQEDINTWQVDQILSNTMSQTPPLIQRVLTPAQIATARKMIVEQLIKAKLFEAYLAKLTCTDEELAEAKTELLSEAQERNPEITLEQIYARINDEDLRRQICFQRLRMEALSKAKVDALLQSSPASYFDGTAVKASHILISCKPYAPQAEKDQARIKLRKIAEEIRSGAIDFAEAARKNSTGPSAPNGGELGQFTFEKMALPFSQAAFALKAGEISGVVETEFGYHLIKISERTDGDGKPGPNAEAVARNLLMRQLQSRILRESIAENPVSIADEFR